MTISKYVRRDHAYVGATFSTTRHLARGLQSVLLSGGQVTEVDYYALLGDTTKGELVIAPFVLELAGLVVLSDATETVEYTQPTNPGETLYLVVSSPDDSNASGLVWTVLSRLGDYTAGHVFAIRRNLGGPAPGALWNHPPGGSLRSILHRLENPLTHRSERVGEIDADHFRPVVDQTLTNTPIVIQGPASGLLSAAIGATVGFDGGGFVLPPSHHAYTRRDRLVLCRSGVSAGVGVRQGEALYGGDAPGAGVSAEAPDARWATVELLPGVPRRSDITALASAFTQTTAKAAGSAVSTAGKMSADVNRHVTARDGTYARATGYNSLYVAYQDLATDDLMAFRVDPDRTTIPGGTDIAAGAVGVVRNDLNMVVLPSGEAVVLYTTTFAPDAWQKLAMSRIDANGAAFAAGVIDIEVFDGLTIGAGIAGIHRPKGIVDHDGNIQIIMEVELSPAAGGVNGDGEALFWMKIDTDGVVLSQPVRLTDPGAVLAAQPAVQSPSVAYNGDNTISVAAIRLTDQTAGAGLGPREAIFITFDDPAAPSAVTLNDVTTMAQVDRGARSIVVGAAQGAAAVSTASFYSVANGRTAAGAVFSSPDVGTGVQQRYVRYGHVGQSELPSVLVRDDGNSVDSLAVFHHSDQLGDPATAPVLSESSEQLCAVHDGTALHLVGWDAANSALVYERVVPHTLNDMPFVGDLTTRFNLLPDLAVSATVPSDILMARGASGEVLIVRVPDAGADAGAILITEVYGVEGEPDPLHPRFTVLAEFDVPAWDGVLGSADITPTIAESARTLRPARELVVGGGGGPGGLVGTSGLHLALETLRGTGGTIRVRAGFYDLFRALRLTSGIDVRCDPGAVFRTRSTASEGALMASGDLIFVAGVDAAGVTTYTGLGGRHLRVDGFTEGSLLREVATGDEYYITEIFEEPGKFRVDDPTMPNGNYVIHQTGISWWGGTFVLQGGDAFVFSRVANASICRSHVKLRSSAATALTRFSGCTDVGLRELYCPLGSNGRLAASAALPGVETNRRVSIRESKFTDGAAIGWFQDWRDLEFTDLIFDNNAGVMTIEGALSTGRIDRIRGNLAMSLNILSSTKVVVGDTDFAYQTDSTRAGPYSDTLNKPSFTDAWFRGNVYISGFLNHGQYDLAILALALTALDDEFFSLFGLVDGFTEDFLTFDDVDPASTLGRYYPGVAPLVLDAPGPTIPLALIGHSDRVAPDYVLDGFTEVVEQDQLQQTAVGGLRGRHAAVRGVIHHEPVNPAGDFTQDGWPDRGKIEFQASFGAAGEGVDLIGEAASYALLQQNLGSSGTDAEQLEFSSVRYDLDTGMLVGSLGTVGGKFQWQRVYDAYTSLDSNRITVVNTHVTGVGGAIWSLKVWVDVFDATSGAYVGGAAVSHTLTPPGSPWSPDILIHRVDSVIPVETYGELAEAKLIPSLSDPTKLWLFMVGRFFDNVGAWENALRVAYIDLSAAPAAMFLDLPGEPAGTKWKNLDSDATATARWRGLSVCPLVDDFNGSVFGGLTDNYAVGVMKTAGLSGIGAGTWDLHIGIFNDTNGDFPAPGGMTTSVGAAVTGFIPCAMAGDVEQTAMVGLGVLANTLSTSGSWPWKPLSGGSYVNAGAPAAVFMVANAQDQTTWMGSDLTAIHVGWLAGANWNAPSAATASAFVFLDLSHVPGAIWDGGVGGLRFLVPYAEGNAFAGSHTQDSVSTHLATWGGAAWVWAGLTVHKPLGAPDIQNLVSASLADQDDATALQRLNVAWQGEPAALDTTWGGLQIDTAGAITQDVWYDADNPEITAALAWGLSLARYWMADREWDSGSQLAVPGATDTLDREHYLLYSRDQTGLQAKVFLRCVGRKLAVKVEIDVPWANNLTTIDLNFIGGGETSSTGVGQDTGVDIWAQKGFRSNQALAHVNAQPDQDVYDGGGGVIASNLVGYAGGLWSGVPVQTGTLTVATNVAQRDIVSVAANHVDVAYASGDRIIRLESPTLGVFTGLDASILLSLMVGGTVVLTGAGGPTEHRITYFGSLAGRYAMVIEPPVTFASHAVPANNTYLFRKRVTGAALTPVSTGEASLVHPERIWINRLDIEASAAPVLIGTTVDTTPVIPPGSAVALLSLIDTDGTLTADIAAGGAALADYLTLELTRDNGATWQALTFSTLQAAGPNPLVQAASGDGGTLIIAYAQLLWAMGPYAYSDLGYRITWNSAGGFPGTGLHLDRVVVGWN